MVKIVFLVFSSKQKVGLSQAPRETTVVYQHAILSKNNWGYNFLDFAYFRQQVLITPHLKVASSSQLCQRLFLVWACFWFLMFGYGF